MLSRVHDNDVSLSKTIEQVKEWLLTHPKIKR